VQTPSGERPEATVSVEERNGRRVERDHESSDVQFCDLGILPVSVTVGLSGCNQVQVKDVPLSWGSQYLLVVTYDVEPCVKETPPPTVPLCEVLFRVPDENNKWMDGASIQFDEMAVVPRKTDNHGRALLLMKLNQRVSGSIGKREDASKRFAISCSRSEPYSEMIIKLDRKK